jgi:hypothetical protein
VALLAECSTEAVTQREAAQSLTYDEGWRDGCSSGLYERSIRFYGKPLAVDRFKRDDARFRTDRDYALGWNDGRGSCVIGRPGPPRR